MGNSQVCIDQVRIEFEFELSEAQDYGLTSEFIGGLLSKSVSETFTDVFEEVFETYQRARWEEIEALERNAEATFERIVEESVFTDMFYDG